MTGLPSRFGRRLATAASHALARTGSKGHSGGPPERDDPKIVVCGWHRTGTTSMHVALQELGYKIIGFDLGLATDQMQGDYNRIWATARRVDGFRDHPWSQLFREFDVRYPNAKFILTERDPQSWLESYKEHDSAFRGTPYHRWLYGLSSPHGHEDEFVRTYLNHNAAVQQHFAERPEKLLTIRVCEGSGWRELCQFLGLPEPTTPFPNNKSELSPAPRRIPTEAIDAARRSRSTRKDS